MINLNPFCFIFKKYFSFQNVVTQFITRNVKHFMYTVNVLRIIAMQEDIGERRRVFLLYMYSQKSLIYVFLDPCIPVFNGHDDFFFFFHCIQKQFMERVANFLFSFPLLLFYSNSFRRRVLLPTQLWGKKGIYQQSFFM